MQMDQGRRDVLEATQAEHQSGSCMMLSIQAVRGLSRLRASGIVPRTISFSRKLPYSLRRDHSQLPCFDSV